MQFIIERDGNARCIYTEEIDLAAIGSTTITRASHVEPDQHGRWLADLRPVGGEVLGPFERRSDALAAEQAWLEANWLVNLMKTGNDKMIGNRPNRKRMEVDLS